MKLWTIGYLYDTLYRLVIEGLDQQGGFAECGHIQEGFE